MAFYYRRKWRPDGANIGAVHRAFSYFDHEDYLKVIARLYGSQVAMACKYNKVVILRPNCTDMEFHDAGLFTAGGKRIVSLEPHNSALENRVEK